VQFLTWASGAAEVEPEKSSLQEFVLGDEPVTQRAINKPYGVAVREGVVYVCDTKGLCLVRMDFRNQTYSIVGGRGPGRLRKPINVVIDQLGYKFVVDPERKEVVVFDAQDLYVTDFDIPEPCHPVDLALRGNEIYVLDNDDSCQVVVLDRSTGEVLRAFGSPGSQPGQFNIPNSIDVTDDGSVYVSDTHNFRVQKLTNLGESVWMKGTPGYTLGSFGRPRGIRVGPDGIIYVVDGATEIVQMFNSDGETLMRFGGPGDSPGALSLPSTLAIDRTSIPYFKKYAHPDFNIDYLLFVVSQYGRHFVNVYAFGSFPEGYKLSESEITRLPDITPDQGIEPIESESPPGQEGMDVAPDAVGDEAKSGGNENSKSRGDG
jgi:sugar lactone lactonase YvrE